MATVELDGVVVSHGDTPVLHGVDLRVEDGERMVLVGPSGAGKTTLLRAIAGLDDVVAGSVRIAGGDVTWTPPRERELAMVFQDGGLLPTTVRRNLTFPLRLRRRPRREIRDRVRAEARALRIEELLGRRTPTLSAGESAQVATGRALVRTSRALLLDEPFARIDAPRRAEARRDLVQLQEGYGVTMVLATNDQVDALAIGHRIAVLRDGRIEQVGPPAELLDRPASVVVAETIGTPPISVVEAPVRAVGSRVEIRAGPLRLTSANRRVVRGATGGRLHVGIRPHEIRPAGQAAPGAVTFTARVHRVEFVGARVLAVVGARPAERLRVLLPPPGPDIGSEVALGVNPGDVHVFDAVTGEALAHGL